MATEEVLAQAVKNLKGGKPAPEKTEEPKGEVKAPTEKTETPAKEEPLKETTKTEPKAEKETPVKEEPKKEKEGKEETIEAKANKKIKETIINLQDLPENKGKSEKEVREGLKKDLQSSLNIEPEKESSEVEFDFNGELKKRTNGQFESLDDLLKASEKKPTFASERIQHLNDLENKGVDINAVLAFNALSIDNLDPSNPNHAKQLIMHELKLNEPDISQKELEYEFYQHIGKDLEEKRDDYDEVTNKKELELANLRLERSAKKAKAGLLVKQKELEIPVNGISEKQKEDQQRLQDEWVEKVNKSVDSFEKLNLEVTDESKFSYYLNDNARTNLKKTMEKPQDFLLRYVDNGQADLEKFRRDIAIVDNFEQIAKSLYSQGLSAGIEKVVSNISNLSTDSGGVKSQSPVTKSAVSQIADKFKGEFI